MNQPGRRNWAAAILSAGLALAAQGLPYVTGHYAKREVMLPMRDGVRLYTAIYSPREPRRPCPILLERTPYGSGPYGPDSYKADLGPSARFGREGFIFVYQDVRGQMMSEGSFTDLTPARPHPPAASGVDESTDTCDTVAWLLEHVPGHNCRVGQWGVSYPGFYAAAGMIDAHPALKAVSPQAPIMDWFDGDDFHHNGALWLAHLFTFSAGFSQRRTGPGPARAPAPVQVPRDGYGFFLGLGPLANVDRRYFKGSVPLWDEVMAHGARDAKVELVKSLPDVERKPWVCTFGILERNPGTAQPLAELLPENKGPFTIMPEPLEWTLGYLDLLLQNGRISKALYRAGITTSSF